MNPFPSKFSSDNRKAAPRTKIGNPKLVWFLALVLTFVSLAGGAWAQPKKVPRIGYLSAADPVRESARAERIRLALRERGYIEGQNLAIHYRYADGKRARFPELATELVGLKVDIIVVSGGNRLIQAARNTTKTIPIVMTGGGGDSNAERDNGREQEDFGYSSAGLLLN